MKEGAEGVGSDDHSTQSSQGTDNDRDEHARFLAVTKGHDLAHVQRFVLYECGDTYEDGLKQDPGGMLLCIDGCGLLRTHNDCPYSKPPL